MNGKALALLVVVVLVVVGIGIFLFVSLPKSSLSAPTSVANHLSASFVAGENIYKGDAVALSDGSVSEISAMPEIAASPLANDPSLVDYYRFEGDLSDPVGNNGGSDYPATFGAAYGKFGQGLSLDGSTEILTAKNSVITGSMPRTVSVWFYATGSEADYQLFSFGNYQIAGGGWGVSINRDESGSGSIGVNLGGPGSVFTAPGVFSNNVWNNVIVTYTGGNLNNVRIYLNGAPLPTIVQNNKTANTASGPMRIGGGHADDDFGFYQGYLDDIAIFNRAFSPSEVASLFSKQVISSGEAGKIYRASPQSSSRVFVGFAAEDISQGNSGDIITEGSADIFSGLSIGKIYYLGNASGTITAEQLPNVSRVGVAVGSSSLLISQ